MVFVLLACIRPVAHSVAYVAVSLYQPNQRYSKEIERRPSREADGDRCRAAEHPHVQVQRLLRDRRPAAPGRARAMMPVLPSIMPVLPSKMPVLPSKMPVLPSRYNYDLK